MKTKDNYFLIGLKGFFMGVCDVIPGISGGTIAFITGIYIRLISAIKGLTPSNLLELILCSLKGNLKGLNKKIQKMDLYFLGALFVGIFLAIFSFSKLISYLLLDFRAFTLAFFVGLILASSKVIFDHIESHKLHDILFGIIGLLIGISMLFFNPGSISSPSYLYVFLGGFLAISALFLPGISGAFILLILGLYEFILNAIHNIPDNFVYLICFAVGAVLGAVFISRVITFVYSIDKSKTLYVLLGIVLGCLCIPTKEVFLDAISMNFLSIFIIVLLLVLGVVLVVLISVLSNKKDKN